MIMVLHDINSNRNEKVHQFAFQNVVRSSIARISQFRTQDFPSRLHDTPVLYKQSSFIIN